MDLLAAPGEGGSTAPGSRGAALAALGVMVESDPGPTLKKLAWGGGLPALVPLLITGKKRKPLLQLQRPHCMHVPCRPNTVPP